jgi:hypothetical protein
LIEARYVDRDEWERELRHYGCQPLEGKGPLNTAEWWRMPWQAWPFTVPVEADGRLLQSDLDELLMMILESAPETDPEEEE